MALAARCGMARSAKTAAPRARIALLLIDFMNPFDFPGGAALARHAIGAARRTALLKARMRARHAPVIYANDNFGRWESDFEAVVEHCASRGGASAEIARMLAPAPGVGGTPQRRYVAEPLEYAVVLKTASNLFTPTDRCVTRS